MMQLIACFCASTPREPAAFEDLSSIATMSSGSSFARPDRAAIAKIPGEVAANI